MADAHPLRTLVLTANADDAELAVRLLAESGISAVAYDSVSALCRSVSDNVGCMVLTGDALADEELPMLREVIENQPTWSDIPLILVAADTAKLNMLVERVLRRAGNVTLLEQPLNPATLISAVRVGLRARAHQVEVRNLLGERDAALRQRDEFLAMLAHELRNPLAPIRNAVYLQQRLPIDDPTFVKTREIVDRQVAHLSRMVDDLLDVARLERGMIQLQRQRIDLNTAVAAAVDACATLTQARRHAVSVNLADEPLPLDADPVRVEQLVVNLITNATKFTPTAGAIRISTERQGTSARLSVADSGIGLRPEMTQAIFNPFTQDDRTLDRSRGGLGIGLTIARRIAELHGGALAATSEGVNKGSTFIAQFPLAMGAPADLDSPTDVIPATRRRVLVVEDNADVRESLRLMLEIWGHDVVTADTGNAGLEQIRRTHPEVAFIDIGLPGMTGYEVAHAIRTTELCSPPMKLIALTGYGQPADRARAFEAGFDMHLLKPVDPDVLRRIFADAQ
mgnify:CR=1 FL=1